MGKATFKSRKLREPFDVPSSIRQKSDAEARAIFNSVRKSVASGRLRAGDRLPPEKALCEQYGSSRYTVRKAMTMLEKDGLVMRSVGRGSFILDPVAEAGTAPDLGGPAGRSWTLAELTEARLVMEPHLAAIVIERAGREDFAAMEACIAAIAGAPDWPAFKEAKYAFHLALVRAAKNDFLTAVFEQIIASRRRNAWSRHRAAAVEVEETKAVCVAESRAILDGLVRGDVLAARDAIRRSLVRIVLAINEL